MTGKAKGLAGLSVGELHSARSLLLANYNCAMAPAEPGEPAGYVAYRQQSGRALMALAAIIEAEMTRRAAGSGREAQLARLARGTAGAC